MPTLNPKKDAFAEGADAFLAGKAESDNPYSVECDDHLNWNDGFNSQADADAEDTGIEN